MKKYLIIYHAPASLQKAVNKMTSAQKNEGMKVWMDWFAKCGSNMVDMGQPLINGKVLRNGSRVSNSTKNATGYTILQAKNFNEVKALCKNHPHIMWSKLASLEIHEMMPMPGM